MQRLVVGVAFGVVTVCLTAAQSVQAPACGDTCRAAIVNSGDNLDVTGADVPYQTVNRKLTLTVANRTQEPVAVMLTNFRVKRGEQVGEKKCPGDLTRAAAPGKTAPKAVPPCEMTAPDIVPGGSARFRLLARLAEPSEHYKFDIVVKRAGKPDYTKDPEIIIDQTMLPPTTTTATPPVPKKKTKG